MAGPVFVIERSAVPATVVAAVAELFPGAGSAVTAVTVAVLVTSPCGRGGRDRHYERERRAADARRGDRARHRTSAPTAGVEHDQPPGALSETNAVAGGSVSDSVTDAAASGPLLVTVMV